MFSQVEDWEELDQSVGPASEPKPAAGPSGGLSLEEVEAQILQYQKKYKEILVEQEALRRSIQERQDMTHQYQQRSEKLEQNLLDDQERYRLKLEAEKEKVKLLQQEEVQLMEQVKEVKASLAEEDSRLRLLKERVDVLGTAPDMEVYFAGQTLDSRDPSEFEVDSRVVWPMPEGTALITFEEEEAAKTILKLKEHRVKLGTDCRMVVGAEPVHLLVPSRVAVDTDVCPHRILVSNLPRIDEEMLLNKLEIHFSKKKNGGGEVESCELRRDIWTVVITFVEKDVAEGLTQTEYHDVVLQKNRYTVKVSPFVNGELGALETEYEACPRTVLLRGIPDVMDQESLQDQLEIHFQKESNGGGEINALLYNPLGGQVVALFQGKSH